jgi:RecB family exonuclease
VFLDGMAVEATSPRSVRPRTGPRREPASGTAAISSPDLLEALSRGHRVFRPTALESYLQCAFQFFGRHTLRLEPPPLRPEERLNFMIEGNIVHGVLAAFLRDSRPFDEVFESVFRRVCDEARIPAGYRREACRERLLADLRAFRADDQWPPGLKIRTEEKFLYELGASVEIKGRIDRLDVAPDGRAFVIDYKYSRAENLKKRMESNRYLQPQLYMLAAERSFGRRPAGMFYCGLRGGVKWAGWSDDSMLMAKPIPPDWLQQATETTLRVVHEIRAGRLAPDPADPEQCSRCDYRDVCRLDTAAAVVAGGA